MRDSGLDVDQPDAADVSALGDAPRIRAYLIDAAREGRSVSYSELLGELGFRFTRPKMRAVCKTLGRVDELCAADGQPDLAVLVVRESDRLPGQGWWVGGTALLLGYDGPWEGASAARFIRELQQEVFDYWANRWPLIPPFARRTRQRRPGNPGTWAARPSSAAPFRHS